MEQIERSESPETEQSSSHALGHLRFCFAKERTKLSEVAVHNL